VKWNYSLRWCLLGNCYSPLDCGPSKCRWCATRQLSDLIAYWTIITLAVKRYVAVTTRISFAAASAFHWCNVRSWLFAKIMTTSVIISRPANISVMIQFRRASWYNSHSGIWDPVRTTTFPRFPTWLTTSLHSMTVDVASGAIIFLSCVHSLVVFCKYRHHLLSSFSMVLINWSPSSKVSSSLLVHLVQTLDRHVVQMVRSSVNST
jgi:hypothetical protein